MLRRLTSIVYQNVYEHFYKLPLIKHLKNGILLLVAEFIILIAVRGYYRVSWFPTAYEYYCCIYMLHTLMVVRNALKKVNEITLVQSYIAHKFSGENINAMYSYIWGFMLIYALKLLPTYSYFGIALNVATALLAIDFIVGYYRMLSYTIPIVLKSLDNTLRVLLGMYCGLTVLVTIYASIEKQ